MDIFANQMFEHARRPAAAALAEPHLQVERAQPEMFAAPAYEGALALTKIVQVWHKLRDLAQHFD
jgi:hypothetical protein